VEELRARGITTSTIGLGADFDERLMEGMSRAGRGHFYFVEAAVQIADCLTGELGETLDVAARDAAVVIATPPGVSATTPNSFSVQPEDGRTRVLLGDLTSRQDVSLVLRVTFAEGRDAATVTLVFDVTDADGAIRTPQADLIWTFAGHQANDAQKMNVFVDRAVAPSRRCTRRWRPPRRWNLNQAGRYDEATARLEATALRIERYAGSAPELRAIVAGLRERHQAYAAPMMAMASKAAHFASVNMTAMREGSGKARRRPNTSRTADADRSAGGKE
jgi:hypothetical protein